MKLVRANILLVIAACAASVSACATLDHERTTPTTISAILAHPEEWSGRRVEVRGVVQYGFEDFGLYESIGDYCDYHLDKSVYVEWRLQSSDNRRLALVRGTVNVPDGSEITTAGGGLGPELTDHRLIAWLSPPLADCDAR